MKHFCKELNKNFDTKEELFKALIDNENLIFAQKKLETKSIEKSSQVVTSQFDIAKAIENEAIKGLKFDEDYYYFVVNSANILDSHGDVHVDGNWNKTVKEQQGKVYLVWEHSLQRKDVIAFPNSIELLTAKVPFSAIGKNYEGETYSLIYKVKKSEIADDQAKNWLEKGIPLQASVRMHYIKIETAINSENPEYAKQKATFEQYYPLIANKNEFDSIDYFWVIKEAKNTLESSLVLFGSNQATGLIQENKEQSQGTQEQEEQQEKSTQTEQKKVLIF